jgi:hypothetical protein
MKKSLTRSSITNAQIAMLRRLLEGLSLDQS